MKVTKYLQSCLLVETPDRVTLFDPGSMSQGVFDIAKLERLDNICITHAHVDHMSTEFIEQLVEKFPDVTITGPAEAVALLKNAGIEATDQPSEGIAFFDSPHENVTPVYPQPEEIGIHYLDTLSHPGDSHSFKETKAVLALPMTGPWGAMINAYNLATTLKPKYILPIHDWHWSDAAREQSYDMFEQRLGEQGITFFKLKTGEPVEIDL